MQELAAQLASPVKTIYEGIRTLTEKQAEEGDEEGIRQGQKKMTPTNNQPRQNPEKKAC
ncbi:MAG: hypothetical protein VYA69_16180 [Gemmatimonadota bacterium]|nr:hypothetical protein [Gemmatimonadota bacterium]